MKISWIAPFSSPSGYSVAARAICEALLRQGVEIEFTDLNLDPWRPLESSLFTDYLLKHYKENYSDIPTQKIVVWNVIPTQFYNISYNPNHYNIAAIYK